MSFLFNVIANDRRKIAFLWTYDDLLLNLYYGNFKISSSHNILKKKILKIPISTFN